MWAFGTQQCRKAREHGPHLRGAAQHGQREDVRPRARPEIEQESHMDRIGADFLITSYGTLHTAYDGKYVGDNLHVDSIRAFLQ